VKRGASKGFVWLSAGLLSAALGLIFVAKFLAVERDSVNLLLFGAWLCALLFLFTLALLIPVQMRLDRRLEVAFNGLLVVSAVAITLLANIALYKRDVHFDLTREGSYTPPEQARQVVKSLNRDVSLTYFYHDDDPQALHAKELLEVLARSNSHLHLRVVDPDTNPALARRYGVKLYNTAVVETDGRRAMVENTTDLAQMAFALVRVLREQVKTVCFVVGHGEFFEPGGIQFHYSHAETLRAHDVEGGGDILEGTNAGFDRFYLALTNLGYDVAQVTLSKTRNLSPRCSVVVDGGPRTVYSAGESDVLTAYLAAGGRVLLMYDPESAIDPSVEAMLARLGIELPRATVLDPTDHYGTDPEKVAVPYYTPHPITEQLALTFFPGVRPIVTSKPPDGVKVVPLFASTKDSYLRLEHGLGEAYGDVDSRQARVSSDRGEASPMASAQRPGQRVLAVAVSGRWPGASTETPEFRLVVIGDSDFATNAYFPSVSNGVLAVSIVRWLAGDESTPSPKPETYAEPQVVLTNYQMKWIFVAIEVILPLSVVLAGAVVWWRRR